MSENDTVEQAEVTEKPKRRPGRPRKTDAEKAAAAEAKKAAAKAEPEAPVETKEPVHA